MSAIDDLWAPKFCISPESKIATFGSCFAQHFGKALRKHNFTWLVSEEAPPGLTSESRRKFNYDVFSARTGNIYTASMLKQWVSWALQDVQPPVEIWQSGGRFYDPFRPTIEPDGFASRDEVFASRALAIDSFGSAVSQADVLVFTLGLTESWIDTEHGHEYPMCPGTAAGEYDAARHRFVNQDFQSIHAALTNALGHIWAINPNLRVLLTVSPVPLTATMSGNHVLVATMESKSTLRAVAGSLAREFARVDYFPSYEIISAPAFRGAFFEANKRSVSKAGIEAVMGCFFGSLLAKFGETSDQIDVSRDDAISSSVDVQHPAPDDAITDDDAACDEALLEAFSPTS